MTDVTCAIRAADRPAALQRAPFPSTRPLFRCGPDADHQLCSPPYSAARLINESCQRRCQLLILSLSRGRGPALHSPPLCSPTGKVPTLLISFFTALCQNIHLQTLKTSAIARHLQPHKAPSLIPDSCTLPFFILKPVKGMISCVSGR